MTPRRLLDGVVSAGAAAALVAGAFLVAGSTETVTPTAIAYPITAEPDQQVSRAPSALTPAALPEYPPAVLDSEETQFLSLINGYRSANGKPYLTADSRLNAAGDWVNQDLGQNGYFAHEDHCDRTHSPDNCTISHALDPAQIRNPFNRMDDFGYAYNTWRGENIAAGYSSAQAVFDAWKASPGHNSNMLGANYLVLGISRVQVSGSTFGTYWTTDFGGTRTEIGQPTPTPSPQMAVTPSPYATVSPPAVCQVPSPPNGCPPTNAEVEIREAEFFRLLNEYRVQQGVTPIQMRVDTLDNAAEWKSRDMLTRDYFAHDDPPNAQFPNGRNGQQRLCDFGYCFATVEGETLAGGGCSALGAMNDWKGSPPHNATMLDPAYRVAGIGLAWVYPRSIDSGCNWTLDLGGTIPCGPQPTPTPPVFPCTQGGTPSPTNSATRTPSPSPTKTASPTPTRSPTRTPTSSPVATPATPTSTPTSAPTPTATPTPTASPVPPCARFDLNSDGQIDLSDVLSISPSFNSVAGDGRYNASHDFNSDGKVNISDVLHFSPYFGMPCP